MPELINQQSVTRIVKSKWFLPALGIGGIIVVFVLARRSSSGDEGGISGAPSYEGGTGDPAQDLSGITDALTTFEDQITGQLENLTKTQQEGLLAQGDYLQSLTEAIGDQLAGISSGVGTPYADPLAYYADTGAGYYDSGAPYISGDAFGDSSFLTAPAGSSLRLTAPKPLQPSSKTGDTGKQISAGTGAKGLARIETGVRGATGLQAHVATGKAKEPKSELQARVATGSALPSQIATGHSGAASARGKILTAPLPPPKPKAPASPPSKPKAKPPAPPPPPKKGKRR